MDLKKASEIAKIINRKKMKSAKKVTDKSVMMKIKRSGIVAKDTIGRAGLYDVEEVLGLYTDILPKKKDKNSKIHNNIEISDDLPLIEQYKQFKEKLTGRISEAASSKGKAEIEKMMIDTFKKEVELKKIMESLLTRGEIEKTLSVILSVLKNEIEQLTGRIATIAPELSIDKIHYIKITINKALADAEAELRKLSE